MRSPAATGPGRRPGRRGAARPRRPPPCAVAWASRVHARPQRHRRGHHRGRRDHAGRGTQRVAGPGQSRSGRSAATTAAARAPPLLSRPAAASPRTTTPSRGPSRPPPERRPPAPCPHPRNLREPVPAHPPDRARIPAVPSTPGYTGTALLPAPWDESEAVTDQLPRLPVQPVFVDATGRRQAPVAPHRGSIRSLLACLVALAVSGRRGWRRSRRPRPAGEYARPPHAATDATTTSATTRRAAAAPTAAPRSTTATAPAAVPATSVPAAGEPTTAVTPVVPTTAAPSSGAAAAPVTTDPVTTERGRRGT